MYNQTSDDHSQREKDFFSYFCFIDSPMYIEKWKE